MEYKQVNSNLLPISKIALGAFLIPWQKRWRLLQALVLPIIGLVVLGVFNSYHDFSGTLSIVLGFLLYYVIFTVLAVTCHLLVLLGDEAVPTYGIPGWSLRETWFLAWIGALTLGSFFIHLITVPLVGIFIFSLVSLPDQWVIWFIEILWIPALYILGRLSLVLPAIALGESPKITWAWHLSKGNGLRLLLLICLIPWGLEQALMLIFWTEPNFIVVIVFSLLFCLLSIVEITALSLAYRKLTERHA